MRVLFSDLVSPRAYDPTTLATQALGGTEATVVRVAEGLAKIAGIEVSVEQRARTASARFGASYEPLGRRGGEPTHVVVLRAAARLPWMRERYPRARLFVWHHDLQLDSEPYIGGCRQLLSAGATAICVSRFQQAQLVALLAKYAPSARDPSDFVTVLANAIDDDLEPDATPVRPDKLVFMSSPHKGLEQTLRVFRELRAHEALRDLVLYVANPGYLRTYDTSAVPNVVNVGALPQPELMRHVREALCAFHWNFVYPETFGIAHAECHAVGTPFLSSALGANPELMEHPEECLALEDVGAALARLIRWRDGRRPLVRGRADFRTSAVVARWLETLSAGEEYRCSA